VTVPTGLDAPRPRRGSLHPGVESPGDLNPRIDPGADVRRAAGSDDPPMSTTDYLIDSTLVLLVLLQIKERHLTTRALVRPLVIVGIAVLNYLHGIPTAGNDLVLMAALATVGAIIGIASGQAVIMRRDGDGQVLARSGWVSGFFWVLGMGSRFAFIYWVSHTGAASIAQFSAQHSITSGEAWTVALLAMAVFEVCGRTLVMAARRTQLQGQPVAGLA
jgi:hypothetical protein